jgi:hypothetical protein
MRNRLTITSLFGLVGVALASTTLHSQATVDPDVLLRAANAMEEQFASGGATIPARLEAARLHIRSAEARADEDPQAIASLRSAALLIGSARPEQSAALFETAAERALSIGDVQTAAHSYLDAASVLLHGGKRSFTASEFTQIQGWMEKAARLSNSPHLSGTEKEGIQGRIQQDGGRGLNAG